MARQSDLLPPDRAGSPSSLLITFAGCYLRDIGGWISVADLIRLLAPLGLDAAAVRASVRRLTARGFFAAQRRSGAAGYALTSEGRADLDSGDGRVFRFGRAEIADGWVLAVFSVPESQRSRRHRLRSLLAWLGFGSITAGVWVAPAGLAETAADLVAADGLDRYVTWFHADARDRADVATWWDLNALRAQYDDFLARWQDRCGPSGDSRPRAGDDTDAHDAQCFVDYLHLVDQWRLFPRTDPGLPAELLPSDWPAPRAWTMFRALRDRWCEAGLRHTRRVTGTRRSREAMTHDVRAASRTTSPAQRAPSR